LQEIAFHPLPRPDHDRRERSRQALIVRIVHASRFSSRRADPREQGPTWGIAGRKAFLQAFVELVIRSRDGGHFPLTLAPPAGSPVLCNRPRCHVAGSAPL